MIDKNVIRLSAQIQPFCGEAVYIKRKMSSSDYEAEDKKADNSRKFTDTNEYVLFGTPIELTEEEQTIGKKVVRAEDQIATDDRGRRRFHGAFTGGFSAGFFNTCGSREGFVPTTFISSRKDPASRPQQIKPETFMDEEDFSEFGIAPKKYSAKAGFSDKKPEIRNEIINSLDTHHALKDIVPEQALYYSLNIVPKQSVGYALLRKLGWKEGRGFGETARVKKNDTNEEYTNNDKSDNKSKISENSAKKIYGCELPPHLMKSKITTKSEENHKENKELFEILPAENETKIPERKSNLFGIGFVSLKAESEAMKVPTTISEFKPTGSEKKGIKGSAYGIGVFDEYSSDDEIYHHDSIANYDFSIDTTGPENSTTKINNQKSNISKSSKNNKTNESKNDCLKNKELTEDSQNYPSNSGNIKRWQGFLKTNVKTILEQTQYNLPVISDNYEPKPVLGEDVSHTFKTGARKFFTSKSRTQAVENKEIKKDQETETVPAKTLMSRFVSSGQTVTGAKQNPHDSYMTAALSNNFGKQTRISERWMPNEIICKRFNIVCIAHTANTLAITKPKTDKDVLSRANVSKSISISRAAAVQGPLSVLNTNFSESQNLSIGQLVIQNSENVKYNQKPAPKNFPEKFIQSFNKEVESNDINDKIDNDENNEKPSLDLFKAVFCDDSDEERNLEGKAEKRSQEGLDNFKKIRI